MVCENDAYPAMDLAGLKRLQYDPSVRVDAAALPRARSISSGSPTRCRAGMDGVILVGCKYGDDYQCHFTKGSELAQRRWRT